MKTDSPAKASRGEMSQEALSSIRGQGKVGVLSELLPILFSIVKHYLGKYFSA